MWLAPWLPESPTLRTVELATTFCLGGVLAELVPRGGRHGDTVPPGVVDRDFVDVQFSKRTVGRGGHRGAQDLQRHVGAVVAVIGGIRHIVVRSAAGVLQFVQRGDALVIGHRAGIARVAAAVEPQVRDRDSLGVDDDAGVGVIGELAVDVGRGGGRHDQGLGGRVLRICAVGQRRSN